MPLNTPDQEIAQLPTPAGWRELSPDLDGCIAGGRHFRSHNGLIAVITCDVIDGKRWLHLSVSRRGRMPTYEDLVWARAGFLGLEEPSYQVFPKIAEHRNFHDYCLHLWRCLDGDPFPDPLSERMGTIA